MWVLAAGLLATATFGRAQVTVNLALAQDHFLPGEAVVMILRIDNQSGQTLRLGKNDEWLNFVIEAKDKLPVPRSAKIELPGDVVVESAQIARVRLDIAPFYDLTKLGNYSIAATVKIPNWQQVLASQSVPFNVIRGTTIWEQEFGVPPSPFATVTNARPEIRKYTLLQANFSKQLQLYVRVTDASADKVFAVYPIGQLVSFGQPEAQVDKFSNLHLLHQTGARSFNYCVINADGRLGLRETHDYTTTRPRLKAGPEGNIAVKGGQRRITPNDLPPPIVEKRTNEPAATKP